MNINALVNLIRSSRIDLSSEKRAQADLEALLVAANVAYEREVRLSDGDIIDFLIDGIGIEVKTRAASKKDIFRQLTRYAKHPRIDVLILVGCISMGLPPQIEGKDAYFVKLGEGWL